ncbi:MAG: phosphoribosyltransferase [Acidobacteriota bacterium]
MPFRNRRQAAELLSEQLKGYRGQSPLVLGIPRGAVPMARVIAEALNGELDVVLVHKLRAPHQPEYAIGSVGEAGDTSLSTDACRLGIAKEYIDGEVQSELDELRQRRARYTPVRPPISPRDRVVIVLDDGVATGWTMIAALRAVRSLEPAKLIAAMAVAPPQALSLMEKEADEVVCLEAPAYFFAVGQFFEEFRQVSDEEVVEALKATPVKKN